MDTAPHYLDYYGNEITYEEACAEDDWDDEDGEDDDVADEMDDNDDNVDT